MTPLSLARIILTVVAVGLGLAPAVVELNRTHATNPLWAGHARFHLVWQVCGHFISASLVAWLLWGGRSNSLERFTLAALIVGASLSSFLVAVVARKLYGGTLRDPNGVPPLRTRLGTRQVEIDMNAVLVVAGCVMLGIAVVLARRG